MTGEERIIKVLTDKLVKVAKWPNMRKHFVVAWSTSANSGNEAHFYKDDPKMSNIEYVTLIHYYCDKLARVKTDEKAQVIIDRCYELLGKISDKCDYMRYSSFVYVNLYHYLKRIGDDEQAYLVCQALLMCLTATPEGVSESVFNEYVSLLEQREDKQHLLEIINDCNHYIEEQKKNLEENGDGKKYAQSVIEYVWSKEGLVDEDNVCVLMAILQINTIIELPPKTRIKKGSFDYNYAKAEKGDKEYQLLVAKAYREGDGVPKNIRLANLWEGFANNKIVK